MPALLPVSARGQCRPQERQQYPFGDLQQAIVAAERAGMPDAAIERMRSKLENALKWNKISPYLALAC